MSLYKLLIILLGLIVCLPGNTISQRLDSLKADRETKFIEYSDFKKNMQERTWVNLVDLEEKAAAVIDTDSELINIHLDNERIRYHEINTKYEKLNMEMALMKSESKKQKDQINDFQRLNNSLLLVIAISTIALLVMIVIIIHRHKKYRQAMFELEQFWSMKDEQSLAYKEKEKELIKELRLLEIENKAMQKEFTMLSDQKLAAKKKLDEEIQSRLKIEREIKGLLGQLKKN